MSPIPLYPGVYVTETPSAVRTIVGVPTSICAFIGRAPRGPIAVRGDAPGLVLSFADYQRVFGGLDDKTSMGHAVRDFFANGGSQALIVRLYRPPVPEPAGDHAGGMAEGEGDDDGAAMDSAGETPAGANAGSDHDSSDQGAPLHDVDYIDAGFDALRSADLFNLLCIPPDLVGGDTSPVVYRSALVLCVERRAMLLVDPPAAWVSVEAVTDEGEHGLQGLGLSGEAGRNAALYFPRLRQRDPRDPTRISTRVPCGAAAGVIARIDAHRGIWKAPAGLEASLVGVDDLAVRLEDAANGELNPLGVNCLRRFPVAGNVIWGARTLRGADRHADEYKYVPVRRLALHLQHSIERGVAWAAFEPNDEPLWAQLRLNIGAFMQHLFRQGAFQGVSPRDAYFVRCDAETTTQRDIDRGVCNIVVGFAPLKPAEFMVLQIAQAAGGT